MKKFFKSNPMGLKFFNSIKTKLLVIFLITIMSLGSVNLFTYIRFSSMIEKFSSMIQSTITAREVSTTSNDISKAMINYVNYKKDSDEKQITQKFELLNERLNTLKDSISHEKSIELFGTILKGKDDYYKSCTKVIELVKNKDTLNTIKSKDKALEYLNFFKNDIDGLIGFELIYQKEEEKRIKNEVAKEGLSISITIIVVAFASILGAVLFSNRTGRIISLLAKYSINISNGNLALKKIYIKSNDELKVLGESFNTMTSNLKKLIGAITKNSMEVSQYSQFINSTLEQNAEALEYTTFTISAISQEAAQLCEISKQSFFSIKDIFGASKMIYEDSQKVCKTSGLATKAANKGTDNISIILEQISVIKEKFVNSENLTKNFIEKSNKINQVVSTILRISKQTSLLSINATIEAAQQSDKQSKGFNVIASEMRKLSNEVSHFSSEIINLNRELQSDSEKIQNEMIIGLDEVNNGVNIVYQTRGTFDEIVNLNQQVDTQIKDVITEIDEIVIKLNSVEAGSKAASEASTLFLSATQTISANVEEQTAGAEEITVHSSKLASLAEDLKKDTLKFKVEQE